MSSVSDIQKSLTDAEHQQSLYADNQRIVAQQLTALRTELNRLLNDQQAQITRVSQPITRGEQELEAAKKEYERAREKFAAAEAEFKKAQMRFDRDQAEFAKDKSVTLRSVEGTEKKFAQERARIEREIDRKEQEERAYTMKAENARRDTDILRRRLEDARRQEMDQLRRSAANSNSRPMSGRMSSNDVRRFGGGAANDNSAPSLRRYGT